MKGSELVRSMALEARRTCPTDATLNRLGIDCGTADCCECKGLVSDALNEAAELLEGAEAAKAELDALRGRAMPEGLSWPRFEDGEPVTFGDAYVDVEGRERKASAVMFSEGGWYVGNGFAHHPFDGDYRLKRPAPDDTQERIDADALKGYEAYWGCVVARCADCPSKVGGKNPNVGYGVASCETAMTLDLLRRQRELDAKEGSR